MTDTTSKDTNNDAKKKRLDISDIENSIDAILFEKSKQKKTTPPPPTPPKQQTTPSTTPPQTKTNLTDPHLQRIPPKPPEPTPSTNESPTQAEHTQQQETRQPPKPTPPPQYRPQITPQPPPTPHTTTPPQPTTQKTTTPSTPISQHQTPPPTTDQPLPHPQDTIDPNSFHPDNLKKPSLFAIKKKPTQTPSPTKKTPTKKNPLQKITTPTTNLLTKLKSTKKPRTHFKKTKPTPPKNSEPTSKKPETTPFLTKLKESANKPLTFPKLTKTTNDTKTTKEPPTSTQPTFPKPTNPHTHEALENLSNQEATWLDQQIKQTSTTTPKHHLHEEKTATPKEKLIKTLSFKKHKTTTPTKTTLPRPSSKQKKEKPQFYNQLHKKPTQTTTFTPSPETTTSPKGIKKFLSKNKTSQSTPQPNISTTSQKTLLTKTDLPQVETIPINPQLQGITDIGQLKTLIIHDLGYKEGTWEELDFYPLYEPFAYVEIIREKKTLDKRYIVVSVELTDKELELLEFVRESLNSINVDAEVLEEQGDKEYLKTQVEEIINDYTLDLDENTKKKLIFYIEKQFLGLDKLEVIMRDPNIEDISCDGANVPLFLYHRRLGSLRSNVVFETEEELSSFVIKLAQKCGKHISIAEPMLDATMPDGSRIQMTLSTEITTKGSTFTIRKFMEDPFSPPDLIEFNTMSSDMVAYMWMAVENGINTLIAGGTAAGKTSALNAISLFIPRESKIVSIEETREINLPHPNWIPGVSRSGFGEVVGNKVMGEIDLYDLMKAALRQRPEYIIVGEIRGREAYVLFQAMATGHTTYSTVHADSAQSLIHRLEGKPINIPRIMLQALDVVCIHVISRVKNKRARRCKQIIEIIDIDPTTKEILTNEVFHWDPVEDKFVYSGKSYVLERVRAEKDLSRDDMAKELNNRAKILEWMNQNNIREFKKVATLIAQYEDNPQEVMKKIKADTPQ